MKVTSVYPTRTFKLIMEFDQKEYRIIDIKRYLAGDIGLLAEVRDNMAVFMTVEIDEAAGTICWANGVDLDPSVLYENSRDIDAMSIVSL